MDTNEILNERGKRYGKYIEQCEISRELRRTIFKYIELRNCQLEADQEDALIMFCVKVSRIINGDPDYCDDWDDVAGYSKLVSDRLNGNTR